MLQYNDPTCKGYFMKPEYSFPTSLYMGVKWHCPNIGQIVKIMLSNAVYKNEKQNKLKFNKTTFKMSIVLYSS